MTSEIIKQYIIKQYKQVDVPPDRDVYGWVNITGDPFVDGVGNPLRLTTLLKHLFCKTFFLENTGVSITSFKINDNFRRNAEYLLCLISQYYELKKKRNRASDYINGVAFKIIDDVC